MHVKEYMNILLKIRCKLLLLSKETFMNISYSFGMVDLMHFGHISAMKSASEGADLSIFGLVSDEASDAWFGAHVSDEHERRAVLEGIKYIDEVWPQATFDPMDNLRRLHSKYPEATISLYSGNEWGIISAKKYVESIGGKVVKLDYYDKLSPQSILDVLNKNETKDYSRNNNIISTKANTLQALKPVLTKAYIEDIHITTVGEFRINQDKVAEEVRSAFKFGKIVVRSSSKREDAFEESNAGHFTSVLNVEADNAGNVKHAVDTVISSYGEDADDDEQVLIQRQTEGVVSSGVVFTRDIQRNRSYYVINYDDGGSTDTVTSGSGGKSAWISHSVSKDNVPDKWKSLMEAVWELEDILYGILLDIEFAITNDSVIIFQVRPLAAAYKFGRKNDNKNVESAKEKAIEKYQERAGNGLTCFSDMAFWNPAEIIGDNPKNLDFSLYREIITKSAWNAGLVPMGYRFIPKELMFRFGNKPYISVERSFEALVPASISEELAKKLTMYYVDKLKNDLSAHDKIEFEISHNCFDFSMHNRLANLMKEGFSTSEVLELENALMILTKKIIKTYSEVLKEDKKDLKRLESVRLDVQNITKECSDFCLIARLIHTLLDSIDKFGTPQFSRHARCAFIAKSLCRSLVSEGYINYGYLNLFMSGINTVAVDYDRDYHDVLDGKMSRDDFRIKYGHLRAGTYNVRSLRYDQMEQLFPEENSKDIKTSADEKHGVQNIDTVMESAIDKAMFDSGFEGLMGAEVVSFIKSATEQREYFKFIFTKSLSLAIELIKKIGDIAGIDVQNLSYLEMAEIYAIEYYSDVDRLKEFWKLIIDKRRDLYKINSEMILPAVICSERDFGYIENIDSRPNFITESIVTGEVAVLNDEIEGSIDGKIVVVEKADPGYDWIFSKCIAGLITKYGGAASHMAIRCAEFQVPAAIGCGASLYGYAAESKRITVDCKHEKLIRVE